MLANPQTCGPITFHIDFNGEKIYIKDESYLQKIKIKYKISFKSKFYIISERHKQFSKYLQSLIGIEQINLIYDVKLKYGNDEEAFDVVMKLIYGISNVVLPINKLAQCFIIFKELEIKDELNEAMISSFNNEMVRLMKENIGENGLNEILNSALNFQDEELVLFFLENVGFKSILTPKTVSKFNERNFESLINLHLRFSQKNNQSIANYLNVHDLIEIIMIYSQIHFPDDDEKKMKYLNSYAIIDQYDMNSSLIFLFDMLKKFSKKNLEFKMKEEIKDHQKANELSASIEKIKNLKVDAISELSRLHTENVYKLLPFDNNQLLATCSSDGTVIIRKIEDNTIIHNLKQDCRIRDILFLRDGRLASCSEDGLIKI